MKRLAPVVLAALSLAGASGGTAVAASPTIRAALVHTLRGCHVWVVGAKQIGPTATITVPRGTRLQLRASCRMDFDLTQLRGPALALGGSRLYAGTTRTIVFRRAGTYRLRAQNVQTSAQAGLQTLGADYVPTLTIVVR